MNKIYPKSGSLDSRTLFTGSHKIYLQNRVATSEINALKVGDSICSTEQIFQNIWGSKAASILCDVSNEEAGFYTVTSWLQVGYAKKSPSLLFKSLFETDLTYEYIVHPTVDSVSAHTGTTRGNKLTIIGTGFSTDPSKIDVKVANIPCEVTESDNQWIECTVGENPAPNTFGRLSTASGSQLNGFVSGSGF